MADIKIDFSKKTGKIKPVHGINNGPVGYGTLLNVSHYYKELGIPHVRLHDPNWPNPKEIDIPQIFRNFDADPRDPASYDFRRSDDYVQSVIETGAQIVYRLGTSIEHAKTKYHTAPPKDFEKWAEICIGIIKHYNHGWAEGYNYDIKYWEIWNEPDNSDGHCMWSGTPEQYYLLYKTAAKAIKSFDQSLKVGGFSAALPNYNFMTMFLEYCEKEKLPLDFFSWHMYAENPEVITSRAMKIKAMLDRYGYSEVEIHLNEWNYFPGDWTKAFSRTGEEVYKREVFEKIKGKEGASFCTSLLTILQQLPIDVANYYDGQPSAWFCGLFDYYGVPQKTYYAFKAFKQLLQCENKVESMIRPNNEGLYCCAAISENGEEANILISNFLAESREYNIRIYGLKSTGKYIIELHRVDEESNLELTASEIVESHTTEVRMFLEKHSIVLLKIKKV